MAANGSGHEVEHQALLEPTCDTLAMQDDKPTITVITRRTIETQGRDVTCIVSDFSGRPMPAPPPTFLPSPQSDGGMSPLDSVFTLCNSAIGAGVLSLPFAFKHSGLVGGLSLCLFIGVAEGFTLYVLSKFAERYKARSYGTLVRRTLGRKLMALLATIMVVYLFGSCVVYLIIIGDTFSALGALYFGAASHLASRHEVILVIGVCILLPLCLLRKLGHLAGLSAFAVAGFVYTATVVVVLGTIKVIERWPHPLHGVTLISWDLSALYALPIVVFGFNCHANVVSIFSEMTEEAPPLISSLPPSPSGYHSLPALAPRPRSHKMIGMLSVIICALSIIMGGYVSVGAAGYIGWSATVEGNILNALPENNIFVQIAQGVIALVVVGHFPLNHHPARHGCHDILTLLGVLRHPWWLSDLFTLCFVGSCIAVALKVTSLGAALHIIGGTAASFMIFFLPGLMLINAAVMKESASQLDSLQQDPSKAADLDEPLLRQAVTKGIKSVRKTGIIYSPRKSWLAGVALVLFSVLVLVITIATVEM